MRDWFDDYLDGMNNYKIVNVPPESHIGKKKPELNILQKKLLFDAAAINEAEMRLMMERRDAEQAELDSHSGGDDGSAATREGRITPSATVPVAPILTSLSAGNTTLSAYFTAPVSNGGSVITNYKFSINKGVSFTARSPSATNSPIIIGSLTNGTEYDVRIRAVNAIGDGTVSNALSGTPVAPPSGIPVASANTLSINGGGISYNYGNTFYKRKSLVINPGDDILLYYYGCRVTVQGGGSATVYCTAQNPLNDNTRNGQILIAPGASVYDYYDEEMIVSDSPYWQLAELTGDTESCYYYIALLATNPSTNPNFIPTTGWTPSITITAA